MSAAEMEANWDNGGKEAYRGMMLAKNNRLLRRLSIMAATTSSTLGRSVCKYHHAGSFTAEEQSLMAGLITRYDIGNVAGKLSKYLSTQQSLRLTLTEGTDMSSSTVSTTGVTVTVGEVGAQVLTDIAAMGAGNPAQELGTVLGNAIATKMDKDIIALFDGFSTSLGAAAQEITVADLFKAAATLRNAKARWPSGGGCSPLSRLSVVS
jgi:hypothetical protein